MKEKCVLGNVTESGILSYEDFALIKAFVNGNLNLADEELYRFLQIGDVNQDGAVTITDMTMVLSHLQGKSIISGVVDLDY